MDMRISIFLLLMTLGLSTPLQAQLSANLVTNLSFNDSLIDESGYGNVLFFDGDTTFVCGPVGDALSFDGSVNFLTLLGDISVNRLRKADFSISFYFKPESSSGIYDIISKREDCDEDRALAITYTPSSRTLGILVSEDPTLQVKMDYRLPAGRCWYHIVIVRRATKILLYVDGEFVKEDASSDRLELQNNAQLALSASPCVGSGQIRFKGQLDEFRVYDRALPESDIKLLYTPRDVILTRDTVIYLGESFQVQTSGTCATSFAWIPTTGVSDPATREPVITPSATGRYQINFVQGGCTATDTVYVEVVDPADLSCDRLLLPSAFTPNGDQLNEEYGISNPVALEGLDYFEIYDRWGTRVFATTDAYQKWDGRFNGDALIPGIYVYKARYLCKGEYYESLGSFSLIR